MSIVGQRGDTIVEVLFAVTVFSMVAVAGLSLMNQGTAMSQRSLEIGLVRDQMDAQADALRYVHNAYIANISASGAKTTDVWQDVSAKHAVRNAQDFSTIVANQKCQAPQSPNPITGSDGAPFVLDERKLDGTTGSPVLFLNQADYADNTETYSKVRYFEDIDYKRPLNPAQPEGIWIQPVQSAGRNGTPGYYDFHIRACWITPGQSSPVTLGTIVRLYDPRA
ncbi:MAG: exported protein of unknown function [Candidatus Saccharibacteria bacterium]|nr:exported protein of unknown function [Candidatus Saccharibacteria bacterium]